MVTDLSSDRQLPAGSPYVVAMCVASLDVAHLELCLQHWPKAGGIIGLVVTDGDTTPGVIVAAAERSGSALAAVVDGAPAVAGSLYLAPAGRLVRILDGKLRVSALAATNGDTIEASMSAIAVDHRHLSAAIVFASAISLAFAGSYAVKEAGGVLLVQSIDPETVPQAVLKAAVPRSEISLLADYIQPAENLLVELSTYVANHRILTGNPQANPPTEADLERIVAIIGSHTGVDFTDYQQTTLLRRIERRMSVNQLTDVFSFIDLLNRTPDEVIILYRELLIGVTRFFRHAKSFEELHQTVVQQLVSRATPLHPTRIWVAGCATGEDAYTLAITMYEAFTERGTSVDVKIFASDLDREAVQFAMGGVYPSTIAEDVPPELLARYFTKSGANYVIVKRIRELVVFAPHNILKDPPFYKLDLVSCRNPLIYLQPVLQRKLFSSFHFALNPEGFLLLGTSARLGDMAPFFEILDVTGTAFRKKPGKQLPLMTDSLVSDRIHYRPGAARSAQGEAQARDTLQNAIAQTLLREFLPALLVVDEHFEILHVSGEIGKYLKIPAGKPSLNLVKMAPRELSAALSTGIRRALTDNQTVVIDNFVSDRERESTARLVVRPFIHREHLGKLAVVVFEEAVSAANAGAKVIDIARQTDQRIKDLELEIEHTTESLQAAIEELETSNEELQATNEELLTANEELQATNEELQSVNEELYTVNTECQARIGEFTELTAYNTDIIDFLSSSNIGTIFLDVELRVNKFTPSATRQFNLIDKDIGRPLQHISNNIMYADLVSDATAVLTALTPCQREVTTRSGTWYLMRILPHRTHDDAIKGVVITFIDISELKGATEAVRKLTMVVENMSSIAMITDGAGTIAYVNRRFTDVTGWHANEVIGEAAGSLLVVDGAAKAAGDENAGRPWPVLASGGRWSGRQRSRTKVGTQFWEDAVVVPVLDDAGHVINYLRISVVE